MEEEKKNHPSLPSNYVTLADLQKRWLKKQQQQQQQPHQHGDRVVVVPTHRTASRSATGNHRAKHYDHRPKIRNDSGGENADLDSKGKQSKEKSKKKVKRNPKVVKERGTSEVEKTEAKKATIGGELNENKTVEEIEHKFGGLSINSKQNWKSRRVNDGFRHSQSKRNYYRYGDFRPHNYEEQKRSDRKMVWVRKDPSVGGQIET